MRKYPKYKDSGVEWIGNIPLDWGIKKTKYISSNQDGKRIPLSSEVRGDLEKIYPYWGSNGIIDYVDNYIFDDELVLVGEDGSPFFDRFKEVSFFINGKSWINNHIHVLKTNTVNPKFLVHSFNCVDYRDYITGSTRDKLNQSSLDIIQHPIPSTEEQQQIVEFLEKKTSIIDDLIGKKNRKIELLKEQRTTIINQTVTNGLNPKVRMKDTAVELIWRIPEGWIQTELKFGLELLTDFESNGSFSSVKENVQVLDEGIVWYVRMTDLENDNIRNQNCKYTNDSTYEWLEKTKLFGGELLVTKRGEIGKVYLFPYIDGKSTLGPNSYLLRLRKTVIPNFLYYFFLSDTGQKSLKMIDKSTTIGAIYKDDLKNLRILIPPLPEQHQIVQYLDKKTNELDTTITLENKKIELLKEYRQSLIFEVVTGKIDVRKN